MEWKHDQTRLRQIERRLYELGSQVKGQVPVQADRISDLLEQIQEVRQELTRVAEKQDRMAEWIKTNVVRKENSDGGSD